MYKIKIFVKTSAKKLQKITKFKNKKILFFLNFINKENNKNFLIISKKVTNFIKFLKTHISSGVSFNRLLNNIYINNILFSPSKKLKRVNFRAKGETDIIEKRNTFVTIVFFKKSKLIGKQNFYLIKKDYTLRSL